MYLFIISSIHSVKRLVSWNKQIPVSLDLFFYFCENTSTFSHHICQSEKFNLLIYILFIFTFHMQMFSAFKTLIYTSALKWSAQNRNHKGHYLATEALNLVLKIAAGHIFRNKIYKRRELFTWM